jgi:predicted amidohydrolase
MATSVVVLGAQLAPLAGEPMANAARLEQVLGEHPDAELAVFPELFLGGYIPTVTGATPLDHPAVGAIRQAAKRHATSVVVGLAVPNGEAALANAALCIDHRGAIAAVHQKTHLFGPDETGWFEAGSNMTLVALAGLKIGVQICFEMEFPELSRQLARAGAELLVTVSANPHPYFADHDLASRARALDNRLPHVYVNRSGREGELAFAGGSRILGSDGQALAAATADEEVIVCRIEPARVETEVDYLRHLRTDVGVVDSTGSGTG